MAWTRSSSVAAIALVVGACAGSMTPTVETPGTPSAGAAATAPSLCEILPSCSVAPDLVAQLEHLLSIPLPVEPNPPDDVRFDDLADPEGPYPALFEEWRLALEARARLATPIHAAMAARLGGDEDTEANAYLGLLLEELAAIGVRCFEPVSGDCSPQARPDADLRIAAARHFDACVETSTGSTWRDFCRARRDALARRIEGVGACADPDSLHAYRSGPGSEEQTWPPEPPVELAFDTTPLYSDERRALLEAAARSEPALGALVADELARVARTGTSECPRASSPRLGLEPWMTFEVACSHVSGVECDAAVRRSGEFVHLVSRIVASGTSEAAWVAALDRPLRFRTVAEERVFIGSDLGVRRLVDASEARRVQVEVDEVSDALRPAADAWAAAVRAALGACRLRPGESVDALFVVSIDDDGRMARHEVVDSRGRPDPALFACIEGALQGLPAAQGPAVHRLAAWIHGSDAALASFLEGAPHTRVANAFYEDAALYFDAVLAMASLERHDELTECLASAHVEAGAVCASIDERGELVDLRLVRGLPTPRPPRVLENPIGHPGADAVPACLRDFFASVRWSCGYAHRLLELDLEVSTRADEFPWDGGA